MSESFSGSARVGDRIGRGAKPVDPLADPRPQGHIKGIWEQLAVVVRAQINSSMLVGRPPACYCARDVEIQVQVIHGTSIMLAHGHN